MAFGEILDGIFQLLRRNFWLFITIAGIPAGAFIACYALIVGVIFSTTGFHPHTPPNPMAILALLGPAYLVILLLMVVVYPLFAAAGSYAATSAAEGRRVTARESYGAAWRHAGRYIWLYVLRALYVTIPMLLAFALIAAGVFLLSRSESVNAGGIVLIVLGALGYLGALVFALVVMLRWALVFPACVVEGLTASAALRRSSQLTVGAKGRIFLVALVIYAFTMALEIAAMIIFDLIAAVGALAGMALHISLQSPVGYLAAGLFAVCTLVAMFFYLALIWASYSIAFSILYVDQRVRLEGYDIERMMQAAGMYQPPDTGEPA
jgi:hypothetical protein